MALQVVLLVIAFSFADLGNSFFIGEGLNKEIDECLKLITPGPNNVTEFSVLALQDINVQSTCLQEYVWKFGGVNWADFNITQDEVNYINDLTTSLVTETQTRIKRHSGHGPGPGHGPRMRMPRHGFSVRREYRRLSDAERYYFHKALVTMKNTGVFDIFAKIHTGIAVATAHGGPGFFPWHRIFCALFEQALRRINPKLSLPYWDTTLDYEMPNPIDTIIFSPRFMGNGFGQVTSGPAANWPTPLGPLLRNIGGGSRLISKEDIMRLLTKCRMSEITHPTAKPGFNAEIIHGGPHIWVGGHMSGLNSAGCDPLFVLYHCFIDYIYELFREHQIRNCGIDPSSDFPLGIPGHHPNSPAAGLPPYRLIDGAASFWTRYWYRYEHSPTCNKFNPSCGSPYLYCNRRKGRCVSVARRGYGGAGAAGPGGYAAARSRGAAAVSSVDFRPLFDAP